MTKVAFDYGFEPSGNFGVLPFEAPPPLLRIISSYLVKFRNKQTMCRGVAEKARA